MRLKNFLPVVLSLLVLAGSSLYFTHSAEATVRSERPLLITKAQVYTDMMPLVCEEPPCTRENPYLLVLTVGNGKQCFTKPRIKMGKPGETVKITVTALFTPNKKGCVKRTTISRPLNYNPLYIYDSVSKKKMKTIQLTTY